jgi:hypothetical protein
MDNPTLEQTGVSGMNNSSYKPFRITAVVVAICLLWIVKGVVGDGLALVGSGVAIAYCLIMPSTGLRVTTFVGLTIAIAGGLMLPLAGFASFRSIGVLAANHELAGGQLFAAFLATMTYTLPTPIVCGIVAHGIHKLVLRYAGVSEGRRHQRTAKESVFGNRRIGETSANREPLAREIDRALAGLKWRIRCYVWLEGILLVLFWLGLSFWAAVALDYLPVLLGSNEMPRAARLVVLLIIMGIAAFIIFWWVLRRAFVSLADHSMAVLLERQFGDFHDSLLTVVEMSEHPDHAFEFNRKMLTHTGGEAIENVRNVRYGRVFNFFPLWRNFLGATVVLGSLLAFGIFAGDALALAVQRLYGLSEEAWPRRAKIEVVGVEVKYISRLGDGDKQTRRETNVVAFNGDRTVRVARGSNPVLLVRADNGREVVPRYCVIDYRTDEGISDDEQIERDGGPRDGFQNYRFAKKPLKGILNSLTFDVVGADHRISDLRLEVVDSPTLIGIQLQCDRPEYTQLTSITQDYREGLQMPRGTRITIQAEANRPLSRVQVFDPSQPRGTQVITLAPTEEGGRQFEYEVDRLDENLAIEVTLV